MPTKVYLQLFLTFINFVLSCEVLCSPLHHPKYFLLWQILNFVLCIPSLYFSMNLLYIEDTTRPDKHQIIFFRCFWVINHVWRSYTYRWSPIIIDGFSYPQLWLLIIINFVLWMKRWKRFCTHSYISENVYIYTVKKLSHDLKELFMYILWFFHTESTNGHTWTIPGKKPCITEYTCHVYFSYTVQC